MKAVLRRFLFQFLRAIAVRNLAQSGAKVVGVTGSAGKTSVKEAIAAVLERRFAVKKSEQNLNSEFGILLTILGLKPGYSSLSKWAQIVLKAGASIFKKQEAYDILVLEMGVDAPGDMSRSLAVVRPDVMVFLNVKDVHRGEGQFQNRKAIFEEKAKASYAVAKTGWVVLNMDDAFVKQLVSKLPAPTLTIGTEGECDLLAKNIRGTRKGLQFTLAYEGKEREVHLPKVLGVHHVTVALAAIAVGFIHGVPWKAIEVALQDFSLPPGRMNPIPGKNGSLIIDSSYNAAPDTVEAALDVLNLFPGRRIAALGTMNELGELSDSAHLKMGKRCAEVADMLIAVGEQAGFLAEGAQRAGMSSSMIHRFSNSKEAGQFLSEILDRNDVVLVKGSQDHVRMEKLVKLCMNEPEQARHLLVRQEPYWLTQL